MTDPLPSPDAFTRDLVRTMAALNAILAELNGVYRLAYHEFHTATVHGANGKIALTDASNPTEAVVISKEQQRQTLRYAARTVRGLEPSAKEALKRVVLALHQESDPDSPWTAADLHRAEQAARDRRRQAARG